MQQYKVDGMQCAACSAKVEKTVSAIKGVTACSVNPVTGIMAVDGKVSPEKIIEEVDNIGFTASLKSNTDTQSRNEKNVSSEKKLKKKLFSSLFILAILMYFSMGALVKLPVPKNKLISGTVQCALSLLIIAVNFRFFSSGFKAVKNKSANMDTLVALGSGISFIYSCFILIAHSGNGNLYFDSAAMILVLVTVGKMLEARAKRKAADSVNMLMDLTPKTASVLRNGTEETILSSEIVKDDIFTVRPGEAVPADGIIISGEGSVDESALTGESLPVDKTNGDEIFAGTVNRSGFITCRASGPVSSSFISRITDMVEETGSTKAPISRTADKAAGIFVPAVIGIALITLVIRFILTKDIGFSLTGAVSVLVISCPCALGLATPVAITVGSGTGARNGILFRSAAVLEETGRVRTVILDKTGTLTKGFPEITDIIPAAGSSEAELMAVAGSLENGSEHPISKAICFYCREHRMETLDVKGFSIISGKGIKGEINGKAHFGGSIEFIKSKVKIPYPLIERAKALQGEGKTVIGFTADEKLFGIVAVADTLREDSAKAVEKLKKSGLNIIMLTGDNSITASEIGKEVGIDRIFAELSPDEKAEKVKELSANSKTIMIGDGINDAPALTAANIGMAIGTGTDIALESADVILTGSSISSAVTAIDLSRKVLKNIKQNLFWAFFYNIIAIPVAAGALILKFGIELNPMICAMAMSFSSITVVTNALRLRKFRQ